jgi:hypothetical protein
MKLKQIRKNELKIKWIKRISIIFTNYGSIYISIGIYNNKNDKINDQIVNWIFYE